MNESERWILPNLCQVATQRHCFIVKCRKYKRLGIAAALIDTTNSQSCQAVGDVFEHILDIPSVSHIGSILYTQGGQTDNSRMEYLEVQSTCYSVLCLPLQRQSQTLLPMYVPQRVTAITILMCSNFNCFSAPILPSTLP